MLELSSEVRSGFIARNLWAAHARRTFFSATTHPDVVYVTNAP